MKFHALYTSSVSACFELENDTPYYAQNAFDVSVNGAPALQGVRTNVFSLFDLQPETVYTVAIDGDEITVHTKKETACINIKDFGAAGDGKTDDTHAIQSAIHYCPPGGRVTVPEGTYYVRPLVLKSHMTLELKKGALLLGDICEEHYPLLPGEIRDTRTGTELQVTSWEGNPFPGHQSFISAHYAEDIAIVGEGVLDGNAQNSTWWENVKTRKLARPRLVFFNHCCDIIFHGITGRNAASWNFHPFFCKNVGFYNIAVEAPKDSPNADGTNPESCDDVRFIGVRYSVGDDAIAIKSGKMYMGMKYQKPATNHVIRNCLMEYAHGA